MAQVFSPPILHLMNYMESKFSFPFVLQCANSAHFIHFSNLDKGSCTCTSFRLVEEKILLQSLHNFFWMLKNVFLILLSLTGMGHFQSSVGLHCNQNFNHTTDVLYIIYSAFHTPVVCAT